MSVVEDRLAVDGRFWGDALGRASLTAGDVVLDGSRLADLVDDRCGDLGGRRLVALGGGNDVELVVTYLAALRCGAPVVLLPPGGPDQQRAVLEAFDPDVVVRTGATAAGGGVDLDHRRRGSRHDLHPDLALLLSTSGSTGAPKLVRLSRENLASNAAAIATSLGLGPDDRAATVLPLHYCYGLSVLNSHLAVGGAVSLTELSVVDPCFWDLVERDGVTNLAGVPHTFELLERAGADRLSAPTLRLLTQAGGRLAPEAVRTWADRCSAAGVDLVVMYGQTEATARMAYLPPALTAARAGAVGVPVPGGHLDVEPLPAEVLAEHGWPDDGGELVYRGPNVMLGYATSPEDLALGRTVDELRTGDVGRIAEDGLVEVVGRRSRFAKPFGLRVDLDRVEHLLAERGIHALVEGDDRGLVVAAVTDDRGTAAVAAAVGEVTGLPRHVVRVLPFATGLPRLHTGKPDRGPLRAALADPPPGAAPATRAASRRAGRPGSVADVLATVLGRHDVDADDTFVSLGGDSLSYVEASVRLEPLLGRLPDTWHLMTVGELESLRDRSGRRSRWASVDTGVVLRALAIGLVVSNHVGAARLLGGAHVLLAVAGYNVARFQLRLDAGDHWRGWGRSIGRIALPTMAWIGTLMLLTDRFSVGTLLLSNNYLGAPDLSGSRWRYWFVEVLVQLLVVLAVLFAVPAVRRFERRRPFATPMALLGVSLTVRFGLVEVGATPRFAFRTHWVAWVFLLGWAAQRARTVPQKVLVSAVAVAACPGFFGHPSRGALVLVGVLALTWFDRVRLPRPLVAPLAAVAAASLTIYLTHSSVHPVLSAHLPPVATVVGTVAAGVALTVAWRRMRPVLVGPVRRKARPPSDDPAISCGHQRKEVVHSMKSQGTLEVAGR